MHIENIKVGDNLIIIDVTMPEPTEEDEGIGFVRASRAHTLLQRLYGEPLCVTGVSPPFVRMLATDHVTYYVDHRDFKFMRCSDDYAECDQRVRPDALLAAFIDVAAARSLESCGITNVGQMLQYSQEELSNVKGIGEKTLRQLAALAMAAGFTLKQ